MRLLYATALTPKPISQTTNQGKKENLTSRQLSALIAYTIQEGISNSYTVDYVVGKVAQLIKENKKAASEAGFPPATYIGDLSTWLRSYVQQAYSKGKDLGSDPTVMKRDRDKLGQGLYNYRQESGRLFVDGITADDIRQGSLGDCYFMAALSAVADTNSNFLKESIIDHGNGIYAVRFYKNGKPEYVFVDSDLLQNEDGSLRYGKSTDSGELWVAIMEKAYAKWKGGYENIGNGGWPAQALSELTGISVNESKPTSLSNEALYSKIKSALAKNQPVTVHTFSDAKKYTGTGLVERHAYTVLDVKEVQGQKYVVLRNPWGPGLYTWNGQTWDGEWTGRGNDSKADGTFMMPIEDFRRLFEKVEVSQSAPTLSFVRTNKRDFCIMYKNV